MQLQTRTHAGQQLHRRSLLGTCPSSAALTCRPSLQRFCKARLQPSAALAPLQAPAALMQQQQGIKQQPSASSTGWPASRRAVVAQAYSECHLNRLAEAVAGPVQHFVVDSRSCRTRFWQPLLPHHWAKPATALVLITCTGLQLCIVIAGMLCMSLLQMMVAGAATAAVATAVVVTHPRCPTLSTQSSASLAWRATNWTQL
jgi:hypothetical protein